MARLRPKQEAFCLAYVETGNASEAYRRSYNVGECKQETVWRSAFEVLENPKVSARVQELRQAMAEASKITVETLLAELEEARQLATETRQAGAATSATMGKAKLLGMLTDRVVADVTTRELPARVDDLV